MIDSSVSDPFGDGRGLDLSPDVKDAPPATDPGAKQRDHPAAMTEFDNVLAEAAAKCLRSP
jgi:hypothetical protein